MTIHWSISVTASDTDNWPQFRGTQAAGVGLGNPPTEWDVETGKNVLWKVPVAGLGLSSPIVYDGKVIITTAVNDSEDNPSLVTGFQRGSILSAEDKGDWQWQVLCYNLSDGNPVWSQTVHKGVPKSKRHTKASHANCTAVTDGKHVVVFFGSEGMFCLDFQTGKEIWKKDLGVMESAYFRMPAHGWGFATSPVIHDGTIVMQIDCVDKQYISIMDIKTGDEIRKIDRADVPTWSTPTLVDHNGLKQIVCNGYKEMAGYDYETGKRLWTLNGGGDIPVPTPLFAHNKIYLTNGHGKSHIYVVDVNAQGDLTPPQPEPAKKPGNDSKKSNEQKKDAKPEQAITQVKAEEKLPDGLTWWKSRGGSYMPTPIVVGDYLFIGNDRGILTVYNAKTGEQLHQGRTGPSNAGTYSASSVANPDRVYYSSENGVITAIETKPPFETIATIEMKEYVLATPAISGDKLLIRTTKHLYCLGEEK